ncbi:MAG: hypothetical protein AAGE59_07285 [Cyanobacteria bacterium P01_F01_bin.86]
MVEDIAKIPQPRIQVSSTETYSRNVLGPVYFELCNLRFAGQAEAPLPPGAVAPKQDQYIIASDEEYVMSVDVKFNNTPLTRLLLCLGMQVEICFSLEAIGGKAKDVDITESIVTVKDQLEYTIVHKGTPDADGIKPSFYAGAAVATVMPPEHPCSPRSPFGFGYIATVLVQVYEAFS